LAAHNPEIDWEKGEVKITRCPPLCKRNKEIKQGKQIRKTKKENEEIVKELVPKRFWK